MLIQAAAPVTLFLITPFKPDLLTSGSCLSNAYYGTYGGQSVFLTDATCIDSQSSLLSTASIAYSSNEIQQLVWVEEMAVDESLKVTSQVNEFDTFLGKLSRSSYEDVHRPESQDVLSLPRPKSHVEVLHSTPTTALLSVPPDTALSLSTVLPRFYRPTPLPLFPISYLPVPGPAVDRIKHLLSTLKFEPIVASVVSNLSVTQMTNDVRFLTGEDGNSGIGSRHSFAKGSRVAASWLKEQFEDTGAECMLKPFSLGFAPNVICLYRGSMNTTSTVLLSAHYDSRGSFGYTRAPGANDDGSGTTALLAIARTIARKGITFRSNVQLVAFAGEEQGLIGSKAYASELRAANANLTLMIQADMLAYHAAGEPPQLGLPMVIGTPEVSQLLANVSAIYSPELTVGYTPACCSDHQSFHEQGFPSSQVYERAGPIADPMYHNSGDLSKRPGYDLGQVKSIAKVQFATLLHAAGYDLP